MSAQPSTTLDKHHVIQPQNSSSNTPPMSNGCAHCGLAVPRSLRTEDSSLQFCCQGCQAVYNIIHSSGFEAYYELRDKMPKQASLTLEDSYSEFDDPIFLDKYTKVLNPDTRSTTFFLEGIHCSACLWLIEKSLSRLPGVGEARLEFRRARLKLVWAPDIISLGTIARHLSQIGYIPHISLNDAHDAYQRSTRQLIIRIGIAGAVTGNVMLMAFALYGGWWSGIARDHEQLFRIASMVVTLPSVLYAAWPFYSSALSGLQTGVLHMDLPISIGILVGFVGGVSNVFYGEGDIYFDTVTALIFLLLVGRLLQQQQQRWATESSELLTALMPSFARRVDRSGKTKRIPIDAIAPGDTLRIHPNEVFPTDAEVIEGHSAVDMSLLSGESVPHSVREGDKVWGGTQNVEQPLTIRAIQPANASRAAQIADLVEGADRGQTPIVQLADRIAGYFVAVVVALAAFNFIFWSLWEPSVAMDRAISLLIVSCPCALGLATPLAITAAIGKAARKGILIRSGATLEVLGAIQRATVFFDKTGTLTYGRMDVVRFEGPPWILNYVAAAERNSRHPVGCALHLYSQTRAQDIPASATVTLDQGGLIAQIDGRSIRLGSPRFVTEASESTDIPPQLKKTSEEWANSSLTPIWASVDGKLKAIFGLADQLRPESKAYITELRSAGHNIHILSGDDPRVVQAIGAQLGLDATKCYGALSPEDKLDRVKTSAVPTIMIGDGVNDAAALRAAEIGIAVHGGAETCFEAADIVIQKAGLHPLAELLTGAKRTYQSIRESIVFSLVYNIFGASLATSGMLNPLIAAILMPISSLLVLGNAFRFRFGSEGD